MRLGDAVLATFSRCGLRVLLLALPKLVLGIACLVIFSHSDHVAIAVGLERHGLGVLIVRRGVVLCGKENFAFGSLQRRRLLLTIVASRANELLLRHLVRAPTELFHVVLVRLVFKRRVALRRLRSDVLLLSRGWLLL